MKKTALVVSGGGAKGAFAVGVIKALANHYPDINFDILVGTSTGALIVPFIAVQELDVLERLYTTVTTKDIITKGNVVQRLLNANALFDAQPLGSLIKTYYDDNRCATILQSNSTVLIATTCLQTSNAVYFCNKKDGINTAYTVLPITNADECRRAVMASASQPVFMPPIEIQKGALPLRQYVDGGLTEYAGIQIAIDAGAEEVFVIALSTGKNFADTQNYTDAFSILSKTIDIFTDDVSNNDIKIPALYNHTLAYLAAVKLKMKIAGIPDPVIKSYFDIPGYKELSSKKPIDIHIIRPETPLGGGPGGLNFEPEEMQQMLAKGKAQLLSYMANLPKKVGDDV
jgi:NTE family protein